MPANAVVDIVWVEPPAESTDAGIDRIVKELEEYLRRRRPYALLFDLSAAGLPDVLQRKRLSAHMNDNATAIHQWVVGLGVVVPSPVWRQMLTAIFWLAPPTAPHRLFPTRAEAQRWAESLRDAHGQ